MRITDLLDRKSIDLWAAPKDKKEALDHAVKLMTASGRILDKEAYRKQVYEREEEGTTGIGEGIAIPHGKCDAVKTPGLAAMVIKDGVDFDSLDGAPVHLLFLIAAPNTKDNVHLDVLSKLSVLLMDETFVEDLKQAKDVDEFLRIVEAADDREKSIDERLETSKTVGEISILAVTSCPTGIAHTYMAAEGLEKAAKKAGCSIKIETRGSAGAKNVLKDEDIKAADCIIIAADAKVPMERFDGKKVIECQVSDGINKADALIAQAMKGEAEIYRAKGESGENEMTAKKSGGSTGHKIYTQLMNGVSHMLPFVVGGGILIALAFLIDGLCVDLTALSETERANFGTITPTAALLKSIGDTAFGFMLPVLAAMMAIDMGGPFNKAAYVFGTAAIAAGNYDIMAAVMVGGMVPPCAIAFSSLFFKNKYTKEERQAAPTNLIMGLAFITEGAIPFAAADPLHVIPACIAGSGVAGAISMFCQCTLMAPHGGIFVFPVVGNTYGYVLALVAGTVISTVLLGLLKKEQ